MPEEKRKILKNKIKEAALQIDIEELVPLYETAVKKAGTRIATAIALDVVLENKNIQPDQLAKDFIIKAADDKNELLQLEAKEIASKYNI